MDLVQQRTNAQEAGRQARVFGPALLFAVVVVAVVSAGILATSLDTGSAARSGVGSDDHPLLAPALIEFRQGERAGAATQSHPLLAPALIEFRQGEHAGAAGP